MRAARPMQLRRWLAAALTLCLFGAAQADVAVPELRSRVTDLTATLSAAQSSALEQKLASFEQAKGSQIVVLLLPTTQPEEIEPFGIRVAERWKIGRKGVDDGAILIIAKDDRRVRIEVGYGLEGALNDAIANRIISETITPRFKSGDFAGGIDAGVDQMIGVIDGEPLPPPSRSSANPLASGSVLPGIPSWALFALVGLLIIGRIVKSAIGGVGGAALTFGSVLGLVLYIGWPLMLAAAAGLIVMLLAVTPLSILFAILSSGGGGGGFSSGGRSGGGFSGGGGSFGGGGASGSW